MAAARAHREFGSIITADEWAQIGSKTPSLFEEPIDDGGYDFDAALPELSRMRYIECRPVASDVATRGSVSSQESTRPDPRRRMSQHVTNAIRKARDSIVGWTRTTHAAVIEGTEPDFSTISYEEEAIESSSELEVEPPEIALRDGHVATGTMPPTIYQNDIDETGGMPLDTMHLCGARPGEGFASITQREAERFLKLSLRAAIDRGEMEEEIIAARFRECNRKDKSVQAQWDASYDFSKASADRHERITARYVLDVFPGWDADSDVDLNQMPFTV